MTTPATPNTPTTAYQQTTQWDQAWQQMEMAKPVSPLDDTDSSNNGVQEPGADGGYTLPTEAAVNLPRVAPADGNVGPPTPGETINSPGLSVFA
jgi:hypothetical protein